MPTASQAYAVLKARLIAGAGSLPLAFQGENFVLPDTPVPFAYAELVSETPYIAGFGGGAGANLYRNPCRFDIYVFVPRGAGLVAATDLAETLAGLFRSYRDTVVSCFEAGVLPGGDGSALKPPGLTSEVNNYFWAVVEVSLHYDQVG